jgi:hypothetical protein
VSRLTKAQLEERLMNLKEEWMIESDILEKAGDPQAFMLEDCAKKLRRTLAGIYVPDPNRLIKSEEEE